MQQVPSGIVGLDRMLNGGLPSKRCALICGGPGSGKTIFCMQFLLYGATQLDEPGLYVSLDEDVSHLREEMETFGWKIEELRKEGKLAIVDASPIRHLPGAVKFGDSWIGKRNFSMVSLLEVIRNKANEIKAKRIVVDPIIALSLQYPSGSERRTAIMDLIEFLNSLGVTSLITTELRSVALQRGISPEEFLTHGVIILHSFADNKEVVRGIQIEKMRGINHDYQIHPYKITENGIEVFDEERSFVGFNKISVSKLGR
jgi:KaiC/GvpD/RAD55 family RecA-like ATPase